MDVYDNLGQFIAKQDVRMDLKSVGYDKITEDGVLRINLEWMAPDGAPVSKSGKKLGTGAYIAKFDFKSKATYVSDDPTTNEDGSTSYKKGDVISTTDNTTKTFGFKRAKR
jgi:hypothetical protein